MKSLLILKALSDESRLAIFQILLERDAYSEVIAERLKLAPSTVSFHLKKLCEAGLIQSRKDQYYTIFKAVPKVAEMNLKDLVLSAELKVKEQDKVEEQYKEKVLKSFFKYGRLTKIPTQVMKKEIVLQKVIQSFHSNKEYSQKEAEAILSEIFEDYQILLKELTYGGFLKSVQDKVKRLV